jgi:hypothetical protein
MRAGAWILAAIVAGGLASPAPASVSMTQDEALAAAFPAGTKVERQTHFLTEAQLAKARAAAGPGVPVEGALVVRYVGRDSAGKLVGTAYFDTHRVRTLDETLMVLVDPSSKVARVDILAFGEPEEYKPKPGWFSRFVGRSLDDDLALRRGILGVTGATLSSQAVTDAVRRILAIHGVLP